ncbi:MAG: ABC transporter permease [Candidatus Kapaibacterium sp.]|jgi:putative ABC transport system permease protein
MANFVYETVEVVKLAGSAVRTNPLRSFLTMLGIIIGIVTVTLMGAFLIGVNDMFRSTVSFMGTDVYYVDKFDWGGGKSWMLQRNRPDVTLDEADQLRRRLTTAKAISVNTDQWGLDAKSRTKTATGITAVGVDEPYQQTNSITIENGRFLSTAELLTARPVCILGGELAEKLFPNQNPIGEQIRIGGYPLQVVGVAKKIGGLFGVFTLDNQVLMPLRTFFSAYGDPHRSVTISVKAKSVSNRLETKDELNGVFRSIRALKVGQDNNFGLNSQDQFNKQIDALTATLDVVGFMITGLSLLVGGIGIMNIMFVTVRERTREIGIRKAIGAKRRLILLQFLSEATMLSLFGGIVALMIAYPLTVIIDHTLLQNKAIHIGFPFSIAALAISLSLAVGLISGFVPAWRASKLDPVDALRYE